MVFSMARKRPYYPTQKKGSRGRYSTQQQLNYYRRKYFALLEEHMALLRELR